MLHRPPAQVQAAARRMASLGVDRVRLTAGWSALAPRPERRRMPRFDEHRSEAYPREPWIRLDRAVKAVTNAGMEPMVDVAFFAPRWAVTRTVRHRHPGRHRWNPDPARYERFAEAVASRYNGDHPDPARSDRQLPSVDLWTTWNEPNHAAFLLPQWRRNRGGRWVPRSPHLFRKLHNRGYDAIKRANPDNRVLIGGLAAESRERRGPQQGIAPLHFLRQLACVNRRLRPLRRRACRDFAPLRGDGLSHHPYSLYDRPDVPSRERDWGWIGDLPELSKLLERLHELGRTESRLPIYITEYGYETNPPDVMRGVSLRDQGRYHGLATYLAWRQEDVAMFAQFLLHDIAPPPGAENDPEEASRDWHSGLYFHDGSPKVHAIQAFKLPFWAESRDFSGQHAVVLFGQVRPGEGRQQVDVEMRGPDGVWRPVRTYQGRSAGDVSCGGDSTAFLTDAEGFFLRLAPYAGPALYRARWTRNSGNVEYGVTIPVGPPELAR